MSRQPGDAATAAAAAGPVRELLLRSSDFPHGWVARHATSGWASCFQSTIAGTHLVARATSQAYANAPPTVAVSLAVAVPTPGIARMVFRAESLSLPGCYRRLPPRTARVTVRILTTPPSRTRAAAYRLSYDYGHELPLVFLDLVLLQRGRDLALIYLGNLSTPFPPALEQRLLREITRRSEAPPQ